MSAQNYNGPEMAENGYGYCFDCGAEYEDKDCHLVTAAGCVLCRPSCFETEEPEEEEEPDHV